MHKKKNYVCLDTLNLMLLLNNECKNRKEMNIYIECLKYYVKNCISKSIMFVCILLNPRVLIEEEM